LGLAGFGAYQRKPAGSLKKVAFKQQKKRQALIEDTLFRTQVAEVEYQTDGQNEPFCIHALPVKRRLPGAEELDFSGQGYRRVRQAIQYCARHWPYDPAPAPLFFLPETEKRRVGEY